MNLKEKFKRAWDRPPKKPRKFPYILSYVIGFAFVGIGIFLLVIAITFPDPENPVPNWWLNCLMIALAGVMFILGGKYKQYQYNRVKGMATNTVQGI